jgi:hypothetical protein
VTSLAKPSGMFYPPTSQHQAVTVITRGQSGLCSLGPAGACHPSVLHHLCLPPSLPDSVLFLLCPLPHPPPSPIPFLLLLYFISTCHKSVPLQRSCHLCSAPLSVAVRAEWGRQADNHREIECLRAIVQCVQAIHHPPPDTVSAREAAGEPSACRTGTKMGAQDRPGMSSL